MKQRITYEIRGQIERNCFFRIGSALVRMEFTGGAVNSAGIVPAQYITDNPLYQRAIENSADFRNGVIKRGSVVNIDKADENEPTDASVVMSEDENTYHDVTNTQQARAILMAEPYKCPLSELQNKVSVRAKAQELGVKFPDWI
ncbi:MAG: hypothetical protein IJA46_04515 [Bacteroidaceae bacterium]|nr:hypothetical protein [Bacteroidaceae bacterium]